MTARCPSTAGAQMFVQDMWTSSQNAAPLDPEATSPAGPQIATGKRCQGRNKRGMPCTAWAVKGGTRCYFHANPEKVSELGRLKEKSALGLGVVSKKYALTAPYYIYYVAFRSHDIPKLRASHWIPSFPHSAREIWRAPELSPFLRSRRRRRRRRRNPG